MASKKHFIVIYLLCIVGTIALFPYTFYLGGIKSSLSWTSLILISTAQVAIIYAIICTLSYLLLKKVDLKPFVLTDPLKRIVYPGVIAGVLLGLIIFGFEKSLFQKSLFTTMTPPPFWAGVLSSIYGGINEEVQTRLFLLTLVYFLLTKLFGKGRKASRTSLIWTSIVIVAFAFAAGHLIMAYKVFPVTSLDVFRIFLLNGIAAIAFGWLYCYRGFWTAVLAHFVTDLMIHAFLI